MGESNGYWLGKEVEHTQFYGMETLFVSRLHVLKKALAQYPDIPHVFLAEINPMFGIGIPQYSSLQIWMEVDKLLKLGKHVTIEISVMHRSILDRFTDLRVAYPARFCVLMVVEVAQLEAGGFSIKAAPPTVFESRTNEGGVMTVPFDVIKQGLSRWKEYDGDIDGEEI